MSSNFTASGFRWWRSVTCIFPSDGPSCSRILAWRSADCVNRTRRIDPKTSCLGFHRYFTLFRSSDGSESCETQPNCGTMFTIPAAPLSLFSVWWLLALVSAFYLVVLQPWDAATDTCPLLCIPFHSVITNWHRESANSHKAIRCKCFSNSIYTAVDWISQTGFCLWRFSFWRTPTSCHWWLRGWRGFRCRFRTIVFLMPETTLVSLRTHHSFCTHHAGLNILPRARRMQPCLSLWTCSCFWQGSKPCRGRIALVFLFMGPVLKFHSVGSSLMRMFDLYFSQRWSFLFPDTRMT